MVGSVDASPNGDLRRLEGAPIGAACSIDQGSPPKRFATFPSLSDAKVANLGAAGGCLT